MNMSQFGVEVSIGSGIFGVLVVMLGFVIRITVRWTEVRVKLEGLNENVGNMMSQLVSAVTKDNDFETRLQLLENRERTHR